MEMPRHPLTQVGAIMSSDVVTVDDTATVEQAWQVLSTRQVGQAPVVDEEGVLVGLLSRADLMRPERLPGPQSHALVWRALLLQKVVDIMWTPVPSVSRDTDIRRLARVLLDSGLPGLPVVDEQGQVTGFVSRSDIMRAVVADPPLDLWT
jgi:CBS-domain-containing membrane protein